MVGLFFPVQKNSVLGLEPSGEKYTAEWFVYAFITVGGYLLISAAAVNLYLIYLLKWKNLLLSQTLFWAFFNLAILACVYYVGRTPFYFWQNWIPGDIMHAFGTEYVKYREIIIQNPIQDAILILVIVNLVLLLYTVYAQSSQQKQLTV